MRVFLHRSPLHQTSNIKVSKQTTAEQPSPFVERDMEKPARAGRLISLPMSDPQTTRRMKFKRTDTSIAIVFLTLES